MCACSFSKEVQPAKFDFLQKQKFSILESEVLHDKPCSLSDTLWPEEEVQTMRNEEHVKTETMRHFDSWIGGYENTETMT